MMNSKTKMNETILDYRDLFPSGKIRSEIRKEENIGKITKAAVDVIGERKM